MIFAQTIIPYDISSKKNVIQTDWVNELETHFRATS